MRPKLSHILGPIVSNGAEGREEPREKEADDVTSPAVHRLTNKFHFRYFA